MLPIVLYRMEILTQVYIIQDKLPIMLIHLFFYNARTYTKSYLWNF